jgi:hypothetical protein
VPIIIAYFTAWVDESAQLYFRDDVYDYDQQAGIEIPAAVYSASFINRSRCSGQNLFLTAKSMF